MHALDLYPALLALVVCGRSDR